MGDGCCDECGKVGDEVRALPRACKMLSLALCFASSSGVSDIMSLKERHSSQTHIYVTGTLATQTTRLCHSSYTSLHSLKSTPPPL